MRDDPPPMLNWAEREDGLPRQPTLPGLSDRPLLAERVFFSLARRWHEAFAAIARDKAPPRAVDEFALSAVLLACEHGAAFTHVAWEQVQANINLAEMRIIPWVDRLPWRLANAARLTDRAISTEVEELLCNLDHHNSALRIWAMELAWMVRSWLEREAALPRLLENVAGTLAGIEMAWGLARELSSSEEDFQTAIEGWQPKAFADQYRATGG